MLVLSILKQKKNIRLLEEKYNKEFFYYIYGFNYAPKDNPDLYFSTYYYEEDPIINDVYLGIMYQYELNKYIRKMIDDAGLTDKVLFLVTTKPYEDIHNKVVNTNFQKYDFKKGYKPLDFLRNGYNGYVAVTLINLKKEEEKINYKALQDLAFKIDELVGVGIHDERVEDENRKPKIKSKTKWINLYVYYYDIDDYDRKVVVDLFKKHPITQHDKAKSVLGLADIYSLSQVTRAETPGFHYLDIYARPRLIGSKIYYSEFTENLNNYIEKETGYIFRYTNYD